MATRGFLIFKYNGVYYVFYNGSDSYASGMGVANVRVLKKLCKELNGNVALVSEHLRALFDALVARSRRVTFDDDENPPSDYYSIWEYGFSLEELKDSRSVLNCERASMVPPKRDVPVDYIWEVDLDAGRFGMGTFHTGKVLVYWSWKALYFVTPMALYKA